jgi:chemotaxis protein methyltransferase CheR
MEQATYEYITKSIKTIYNIDLNYYKSQQMHRRLDSWLIRTGASDWESYFDRIKLDENEMIRFRNYLTINVTEFFRDPERWQYLKNEILPGLYREASMRNGSSGIRVWSAGCSIGVEAYSLSILMNETANAKKDYLLATDLDRGALMTAKNRGPYSKEDVRQISDTYMKKFFEPKGPPYHVTQNLASNVVFREQNLMEDKFEEGFDLIVCRNVVIYFTNDAKTKLYHKFHNALRPGGILFLGGTEIIPRPNEFGFKNRGVSFYIRVD